MLRRSDFILDKRPLKSSQRWEGKVWEWEDWCKAHPRPKEQWLMSIIETLLKNNDWAGGYLLIQTYISTCKQAEGTGFYNRTPFDESVHVRAVKQWFWSLVEEYGFATEEKEAWYDEESLQNRRAIRSNAELDYPFVGGKPKRRYSEAVEFFQQVEADKVLNVKSNRPEGRRRKKEEK